MIDIGPNLTHVIVGIGHLLKFAIEAVVCLVIGFFVVVKFLD